MTTAAAGDRPTSSTFDVESYAAGLAADAPQLTTDQLDALGQVMQSTFVMPVKAQAAKPRRHGATQLLLPYHQVDPRLPGDTVHEGQIVSSERVGDVEQHPIAASDFFAAELDRPSR